MDTTERQTTTRRRAGRLGAAIAAVAMILSLAVSTALAGEVKGPPNQVDNTDTTGAVGKSNSACAASGLNDFDPDEGQNESQVQTAADSWRYYGLEKGDVGRLGLCRGGTGER